MIQTSIFKPVPFTVCAAILMAALVTAPTAFAADAVPPAAKPAEKTVDAEADAWAAVKNSARPPVRAGGQLTREEQEEYMQKAIASAGDTADKAAEFITKYPQSDHIKEARALQINALQLAALKNKEHEAKLRGLLTKTGSDASLDESERVKARVMIVQLDARKAGGQAEAVKAMVDGYLTIQKDFPKNQTIYAQMLSLAESRQSDETRRLVKAVAGSDGAPEKLKKRAQDILDGKVFSASGSIGKPVEIKFTAVDGTGVDLAKMKGKVVLVDFWATWCGPCVAEIPHVKEAYEKYHDKGFEIIGISFDREGDKDKLIKFTKSKGMPWVQYFDGKHWENDFGQRFNIRSIPAMWLIDKNGNLADVNARSDLAGKVAKLLEAN